MVARCYGSAVVRAIAVFVALLCVACGPARPSGTPVQPVADFRIDGKWQRCHELGTCVYQLVLQGPDGEHRGDLEVQNAGAQQGPLVLGPEFPARLVPGPHTLTLISTMLGDTIEPNGEQTVLGEEARCSTRFTVTEKSVIVNATFEFVPQRCAVEVIQGMLT